MKRTSKTASVHNLIINVENSKKPNKKINETEAATSQIVPKIFGNHQQLRRNKGGFFILPHWREPGPGNTMILSFCPLELRINFCCSNP